jgi:hypothetical protein
MMFRRKSRIKLPELRENVRLDEEMRDKDKDREKKEKMKGYAYKKGMPRRAIYLKEKKCC